MESSLFMKIVFATGNPHKLKEIKEIAGDTDITFVLPAKGFNPVENGKTFEENSLIKAREAARVSQSLALADDSGLCVEALGGEPGIYSARYAETPQKRIDKLLSAIEPFENRKAKFVCAMTLVNENGDKIFSAIGECHGKIAKQQAGCGGVGFDPLFFLEGQEKKIAELTEGEKKFFLSRGKTIRKKVKRVGGKY